MNDFFSKMREQTIPDESVVFCLIDKIKADKNKPRNNSRELYLKIVSAVACLMLTAVAFWFARSGAFTRQTLQQGITIPAIIITDYEIQNPDVMLGLIVYKGNIYTESDIIYCDEERMNTFINKYLGTATGKLDEWSSKDEYSKELASNSEGDVYSINGYDVGYMICIAAFNHGYISFYEKLNDITLLKGQDLYGDLLHMKENYSSVKYQLHDDWDWGRNIFNELDGVSEAEIKEFINNLYESPFVEVEDSAKMTVLKQVHLYFLMKDGKTISIRLFENGYILYDNGCGRYIGTEMNGRLFTKIFEAG